MSAYVVSDSTINAILSYTAKHPKWVYVNGERIIFDSSSMDKFAQDMLDYNYESVNYLCGDNNEPHKINYSSTKDYDLCQIIKLCDCWMYQSCERPDYKDNQTYKMVEKIRDSAVSAFLHTLPAYQTAKWRLP